MKIRRRDFLYSTAGILASGLVCEAAAAAFHSEVKVPSGCAEIPVLEESSLESADPAFP